MGSRELLAPLLPAIDQREADVVATHRNASKASSALI